MQKKLIVIGGGASGFFCAVNAKRMNPGLDVTIVEKTGKVLSKVRISGGGRCNVTHENFEIPFMSGRYPRGGNLVKKIFHQFFTTDTIEWFRSRGVMLKAEADGRMFPVTNSSETIIDCLMREMNQQGVQLLYNKEVKHITKDADRWILHFSEGEMVCDYICIACGGYPKASTFAWLTETGHKIEEPVPSLFTFNMPGNPITALMGVSVENVQVQIKGTKLRETGPLLVTHWGMSGPAVLRLSAWGAYILSEAGYKFSVLVNWLPGIKEPELREIIRSLRESAPAQKIMGKNPFGLPHRLWEFLVDHSGCKPEWRWADLPAAPQNQLIKNLSNQEFAVSGKTTYKEEFVTAGGIRLNEIDANTLESRLLPGVYFAGEILNVDGITGGFNFQFAWTSGYVVAKAIAAKLKPMSGP